MSRLSVASKFGIALIVTLLFSSVNQVFAQDNSQKSLHKPVKPYVFHGDLSKLPKDTGKHPPALAPAINPEFPLVPFTPLGLPDPKWQKTLGSEKSSAAGPIKSSGVTSPQFTTPSPNFDTNQPGDGPPDDNGAVGSQPLHCHSELHLPDL